MAFLDVGLAQGTGAARARTRPGPHPAQTGLPVFCGLIAEQAANGNVKAAGRLALKAFCAPGSALAWVAGLDRLCSQVGVAAIPFELARKPTRSFLHQGLSARARTRLLTSHYALILTGLGGATCRALLSGARIEVLGLMGREGAPYRVSLERSTMNAREGEMSIALWRAADDLRLASLSLVFGAMERDGPAALWIGGLQGAKADDAKAATVDATKALSGLRPKDLLMIAAYGLAQRLGVSDIRAISNGAHIHAEKGGRTWTADYDAFWIEQGASPGPDGFFHLPPTRRRRTLEEVAPAKRKAWMKKQDLGQSVFDAMLRL